MKRMFVLFKRYNREIINIDSDVDALTARTLWSLHGPLESKDALVGMCLSEAEIFQPREECALPSTPGLRAIPYTGLSMRQICFCPSAPFTS